MRKNLAAALLLAAGALAACGDSSDGADDASESTPTQPEAAECAEVWRAGEELPHDYRGCTEGDEMVQADDRLCSSGQELVRYSTTHYAVRGGPIQEVEDLDADREFQRILRDCRG